MREYPVTRNELLTLGGVGLLASACFGLGANFTFSSLQLQENLELSQNQGISPQIIAKWEAREYDYWYFGIALLIIGALAVAFFSATIWDIIKSTEYQD